jgi:hypothetical protein
MKKIAALVVVLVLFTNCKEQVTTATTSDVETSIEADLVTMRGEFIYYDKAAVLQTPHTIYGVILDDMAETLRREIAPYKTQETDMVTVTLRAKRIPKPASEEGWPIRIEIKDILKIEPPEQGAQQVIEISK